MNIDLNEQEKRIQLQLKKNKIWSNVLTEQLLCDDLLQSFNVEAIGEKKKDGVSEVRNVESYLKESDVQRINQPRRKFNKNNKKQNKRSKKNKKNKKKNNNDYLKNINKSTVDQLNGDLVRTKSLSNSSSDLATCEIKYDETKSRAHILANEFDSEEIVCKEIVRQLNERKSDLIMRCVKTLGKKKCLELLYATEDIEEHGGMYSEENKRRRSPGGVFIQLIKRDEQILSSQRKIIFALQPEEKKIKNMRKKIFRKRNRSFNEQNNNKKEQNDSKNEIKNQGNGTSTDDVLVADKNEASMDT